MSCDDGWLSATQLGAAVAEVLGAAAFAGEDGPLRAALVAGTHLASRALPHVAVPTSSRVRNALTPRRAADCLASEGVAAMPSQAPLGLNLKARRGVARAPVLLGTKA